MTTMEKLVEAYLEKERIIKEQAEAIMKLQSELLELEKVNSWSREITRKLLYGKTITKEDREQGERFRSRLVERREDE